MAFTEDKNIMGSILEDKKRNAVSIASSTQATSAALAYGSTSKFFELETGEVVDIILDQFHPKLSEIKSQITTKDTEYNTGYTGWNFIGYAKIRLINTDINKPYENLMWYPPLFNGIKRLPLLHELVIVGEFTSDKAIGNHTARTQYYIPIPLGVHNSLVDNAMPNVSIDEKTKSSTDGGADKAKNYQESETGAQAGQSLDDDVQQYNPDDSSNPNGDFLGNTYDANYNIRPLIPFEGDTIIEGRFGQSIRMGSTLDYANTKEIPGGGQFPNWWSEEGINGDPILIIRNGQSPLVEELEIDEPTVEDFDEDGAVIMLTGGQRIDFKPACDNMVTWKKTQPYTIYNSEGNEGLKTIAMDNYPFSGNQIMMASDRIVMNARKNEFMVYANGDIGFSTNGDFHINCRALRINAAENHNMTAPPKGKADAAKGEPAVLGRQLSNLIQGMVRKILALRYPGAPGVVDASTARELRKYVSNELDKICSKQAFHKAEKGKEVNV